MMNKSQFSEIKSLMWILVMMLAINGDHPFVILLSGLAAVIEYWASRKYASLETRHNETSSLNTE